MTSRPIAVEKMLNARASSLLKNSTGCAIAWMRSQNNDASRYFASRAELRSALGEVEKCQEGIFQRAASATLACAFAVIALAGWPAARAALPTPPPRRPKQR